MFFLKKTFLLLVPQKRFCKSVHTVTIEDIACKLNLFHGSKTRQTISADSLVQSDNSSHFDTR
jgi:hypothetical protein